MFGDLMRAEALHRCTTMAALRVQVCRGLAALPAGLTAVHESFPARIEAMLACGGQHFEGTDAYKSTNTAVVDYF